MKNCKNCGAELPDFAMFCDECGTPWQDDPPPVHVQPDTKQDGKNNFLLIAVVITLTVVIGLLLIKGFEYLVNLPNKPKADKTPAISSVDPSDYFAVRTETKKSESSSDVTVSGKTKPFELRYISMDIPEEYSVDWSEYDGTGIVHIDHPKYPEIIDRLDFYYDDRFDSATADAYIQENRDTFLEIERDDEVNAADFTLHIIKGTAELYEGGIYSVGYYLFYKDSQMYELIFISDGKDSHLKEAESDFVFNPGGRP